MVECSESSKGGIMMGELKYAKSAWRSVRIGGWLAVTTVSLCSCSLFGSPYQEIRIASDPAGATVLVDDEPKGTTPVKFSVRRNQDLAVEIRKFGYRSEIVVTEGRKPSTLGLLDMIGGSVILVPFLGLLSDAAWDYSPSAFAVRMTELEDSGPHE